MIYPSDSVLNVLIVWAVHLRRNFASALLVLILFVLELAQYRRTYLLFHSAFTVFSGSGASYTAAVRAVNCFIFQGNTWLFTFRWIAYHNLYVTTVIRAVIPIYLSLEDALLRELNVLSLTYIIGHQVNETITETILVMNPIIIPGLLRKFNLTVAAVSIATTFHAKVVQFP